MLIELLSLYLQCVFHIDEAITIMVRENSNSFDIGVWCNGNTTVFGAVIIGSNPITPTD